MAKTSAIQKNLKRIKLTAKYQKKRVTRYGKNKRDTKKPEKNKAHC